MAPLDDAWRQQVAALTAKGQEILGLGLEPEADAATIADRVHRRMCDLRERPESVPTNDKVAIAVAYGDAIARVTGWQWNLYLENRDRSLAVVSPDAKYAVLPVDYIGRQLAATREVTALLLFNMLAAGQYSEAETGDPEVLG